MRRQSLNEFGNRVDWFKNDKFLRDLEGDSVDTEILDEELRSLQDDDHSSCRGKTVRFLESNPLQIVLCVLVLVDAGVVVAEILLDLHALRGQYNAAEESLTNCLSFLKARYAGDLTEYNGQNIDVILAILREQYPHNETTVNVDTSHNHRKRHLPRLDPPHWESITVDTDSSNTVPSMHLPLDIGVDTDIDPERLERLTPTHSNIRENPVLTHILFLGSKSKHAYVPTVSSTQSVPRSPAQFPSAQGTGDSGHRTQTHSMQSSKGHSSEGANAPESPAAEIGHHRHGSRDHARAIPSVRGQAALDAYRQTLPSYNMQNGDKLAPNRTRRDQPNGHGGSDQHDSPEASTDVIVHEEVSVGDYSITSSKNSSSPYDSEYDNDNGRMTEKVKLLLKTAHVLHYISIAILGVFVIQVFLKIFGMRSEFFRKKMEVFDAVIIIASFQLDIVFLDGVGPGGTDEGAALVIIFLLWRLLRVINGIMVTAKQRQEFRIKLQKRARRRGEKRIEMLEEDRQFKDKEISNLQTLCEDKGATEKDISYCRPRRRNLTQKNTQAGLSSIASLSLGFTMSMHMAGGSGTANSNNPGGMDSRRASIVSSDILAGFQFGGRGMARRPSSASSKSSTDTLGCSVEKRPVPERTPGPMVKGVERVSMERVLEESNIENIEEDNNNSERRNTIPKNDTVDESIRTPELVRREKVLPMPIIRLRRHHELNGDAVHLQLEDVIESDDETAKDTSSTPDISVTSQVPQVSEDTHTQLDSLSSTDESTTTVPPRAAVVAIDIPNGPVAIATSPLETSHLETNSDHITWYSRRRREGNDDKLSPTIDHNETIQGLSIKMSSPLTSLSSVRTTPSPTLVVSDRDTPSPSSDSTQSW